VGGAGARAAWRPHPSARRKAQPGQPAVLMPLPPGTAWTYPPAHPPPPRAPAQRPAILQMIDLSQYIS
jgi:hypothetical protein